jgi:hypothetical protein
MAAAPSYGVQAAAVLCLAAGSSGGRAGKITPARSSVSGMRKLAIAITCVAVSGGILLYAGPFALRGWYVSHGAHSYHKVKCDIIAIEDACAEYAIQRAGESPPDLEALVIPDEEGFTFLRREQVPLDPWGNPYGYERPGRSTPCASSPTAQTERPAAGEMRATWTTS